MNYRWRIAPAESTPCESLAKELNLSPLLVRCMLNRGISETETIVRFLNPQLRNLKDPFRLPGMQAAVERLFVAREQCEPIVIFGDYDVDGVTSTALIKTAFTELGWEASSYLPQRMDEGYGLSEDAVEKCLAGAPCSILLAVDCGSTAVSTINQLQQRGIDVIVLDHHQISNPAPSAYSLVNPRLGTVSDAEGTELCSVGLAFKLVHALVKRGRELGSDFANAYDVRPLLDMVALGTIADLVPLRDENRILVTAGLKQLNSTKRPGLNELRAVAACRERIGVYEVAFQLAPRLNAAGRLEDASEALQLMLTADRMNARTIAENLDSRNRERQRIERSIVEEVIGAVRAKFNPAEDYVIVEGKLSWHIGVVGIVASRVVREFHRPTIIIGGQGTESRGSGRSIEGFDLVSALRSCADLLIKHGGHAMAAGLTIDSENINAFRKRLNELAKRHLKSELLNPALNLDADVALSDIGIESLTDMERMRPFGQGNPPIQFAAREVCLEKKPQPLGRDRKHLKMKITDGKVTHEAVWWNANGNATPDGKFDLAFAPEINEFNGRRSVQLRVLDWKPIEGCDPNCKLDNGS